MKLFTTVSALTLCAAGLAQADCGTVTMSDVGWTDITTTTSTAKHVLEALGYEVDVKVLSVPVTFASLESDDVDVFLGNWMPAQTGAIGPYLESGEVKMIASANASRHTYAPDTATVPEQGFDIYVDPYFYIAAPAGLPAEASEALNSAISAALASDAAKTAIMNAMHTEPSTKGPAETKQMLVDGLGNVGTLFGK
jgi:hypothetical protein